MTDSDHNSTTDTGSDSVAIDSDRDPVTDIERDPVINCRELFCDR